MEVDISGLDGVQARLKEFGTEATTKAQNALRVYAFDVLAVLQMRSPMGNGKHPGRFKGAWQIANNHAKPVGAIASIAITNNMPYSGPLEHGSPAGGRPWPNPGPRTVLNAGRVWSSQAVGGVAAPIMDEITKGAARAVIDAL